MPPASCPPPSRSTWTSGPTSRTPPRYDLLYGDPGAKLLLSDYKRGYKGLGTEKPMIGRLALHAGSLGFTHPGTREPVEVTAPLPKEFEIALKNLRKFAGPRRGAA
jgi:hypothetical protein